ncbi:hypothetical protein [Moraxella cuniculi]|uniref:Uncharacterized protein n=1 Tax=Moraxella cuniculi TaxID=34061 RepID=A0A448GX63_9GAMM|nr:hypothetical protein [Moraxella cuniculi]VEG13288.1 Uncharacterised protein [Moraxella cuniculi]
MGFLGYLLMGSVVYVVAFMINIKLLRQKRQTGKIDSMTHPVMIAYLLGCFVVMLGVSMLLGRFVLNHQGFDWAFIGVNSLVATVIFYFGLNPDTSQMDLPD